MNSERWRKVKGLFDAAVELPPKKRKPFLDQACGNDEDLRHEVENLLVSSDAAESFMESPAVAEVADVIEGNGKKLENGKCFGHYEIIKQIGAGGMGEVYLTKDTKLDRLVAVKILNETFAAHESNLARFTQEAKAASALNHPNILVIHEIGEAENVNYIVSEFIEGKTLREHFGKSPMKLSEVLDISIQIANALVAAHTAHIVHRDIKPENIMIRPDGYVKILDFGIAKLVEQKAIGFEASTIKQNQTAEGVILGTINYMSPEQAKGERVDERTDIFSFGVLLYEMITGKRPFAGKSVSETFANLINAEPQPLSRFSSNVPDELQRIVAKTLRKNKDQRYQTMKDLLTDLKEVRQELEFQHKLERTTPLQREETNTHTILAATTEAPSSVAYVAGEVKKHQRSFTVGLAILLLAVISLGYWFFAIRIAGTKPIESIAVMPFVNESGNADVEYLSDGITETLISSLSQIPKLNVKARSSVFRYKGKDANAQTIGKELNVESVLNGRVVQRGQDLILYVELIDAATENVLWKEDYNRSMLNLVSLQSEVARDVSQKLKTKLSGTDEQRLVKNSTENPEAYQLYLKGRFHWNKRRVLDFRKSIEYLEQATAADPNYALAYAGLANAYALLSEYGGAPPREAIPKARNAALKALSLDDRLAEAHAALALVSFDDYDFAGAEREYKRAIELNPNDASTHQLYAAMLTYLSRHEEALAEVRRALEIDPLSLANNRSYGDDLLYARRYDEGLAQLKKTLDLDANFASVHASLFNAYRLKGDYAASIEEFAKNQELIGEPQNAVLIRESFAGGGWEGFLRAMTGARRPANLTSYLVATFHTALGEKDKAFAELNRAYDTHEYFLVVIKVDPRLDPLRDDPRFQDLLRRMGLQP